MSKKHLASNRLSLGKSIQCSGLGHPIQTEQVAATINEIDCKACKRSVAYKKLSQHAPTTDISNPDATKLVLKRIWDLPAVSG